MKNHNQNSKKRDSKESEDKEKNNPDSFLSHEIRRSVFGIIIILVAIIIALSFFDKAGAAGGFLKGALSLLFGKVMFVIPLFLILFSFIFFKTNYRKFFSPAILAIFVLILGVSGFFGTFTLNSKFRDGGLVGYVLSWPLAKLFGILATRIILAMMILISLLIFRHLLKPIVSEDSEEENKPFISRIFKKIIAPPKLKIKEVAPEQKLTITKPVDFKTRPLELANGSQVGAYQPPPTNLLESDREIPNSGDTRVNSAIIKKTLQNFDIQVEMSEINIGPTVTQYTLKPAEGVKLSKITALSNDLSLVLASHPIRIEAPIPGRSLVGIEVPNKTRAQVRLRNLIENLNFKNSPSNLIIILGRDVSGVPVYADLSRMPHLLVAGATGTGKTIFLNTLILSLLYKNSTETLKFILIDPKRVEFTLYNNLPHLLCPVIHDPQRAINALKWLTGEMERRFEVFAQAGARDIGSYNEKIEKDQSLEVMPYIILIVDELADLMAARGREIEAGIVRLAQMARAVGIHLVVATQRPSVEVITGLIKANITSRITFQVASQVDSRTVIDVAGAEKLLGLGDLLYISADTVKPKRIQGPYVSEKELRKAVNYIKSKFGEEKTESDQVMEAELFKELEKTTEVSPSGLTEEFSFKEDPLYEDARGVVLEARKASASLLQRRLRIGYARAARLIDILEERGVVGPANGAKPRDVFPEEYSGGVTEDVEKNQEN